MDNSNDIKVKALVDKEKNKVVFAESDGEFGDVLFSFVTIPMGIIVSLNENGPTIAIGCMNKLYECVQNLDVKYFRTIECRKMLLHPRNGEPIHLKVSIDDHIHTHAYCCVCKWDGTLCQTSAKRSSVYVADEFLKGLTQLVISDDLQLMHQTSSASFSFLSEYFGVMDATASALEAREFRIGQDEVIHLLKNSLVSKEALTKTLLRKNEPHKENLFRANICSSFERKCGLGEAENGKIDVKLFISKSKKKVCFAEVGGDFVDLVFSFLTIPLGHVLKQLKGATSIDGCVDNVYRSIADLDVKYFNSSNEKEILLNPKIAPKYGYKNQLLKVEEISLDAYNISTLYRTVKDPKIPTTQKEDKSNGGFMEELVMFTVTDDLNVLPLSVVSRVTILSKLDVPLHDIAERVVYVGKEEAAFLLVASFVSESALTETFLKE